MGNGHERGSLWYWGVAISIGCNIVKSFGLIIQKTAHNRNHASPNPVPYWRNPLWLLGFAIYAISNAGNSSALAFASAALITPLGSVSLCVNALLAPVFLKENFGKFDFIGTLLIIVGTAITVIFGFHGNKAYDAKQLESLYFRLPFLVFFSLLIFALILTLIFAKYLQEKIDTISSTGNNQISFCSIFRKTFLPCRRSPGGKFIISRELRQMTPLETSSSLGSLPDPETTSTLPPAGNLIRTLNSELAFACTALAAMLSTVSQLMMKSEAELVSKTVSGANEFSGFFAIVILVVLVASILGEISWLQLALKKFDALFVVPVFQVLLTILTVVSTSLYFGEFLRFTLTQALLFPFGIFVTLLGTCAFALRGSNTFIPVASQDQRVDCGEQIDEKISVEDPDTELIESV